MGDYIKKRAENHIVIHEFSGKQHFFKVESNSGESHSVSVQVKCSCTYMAMQGAKDGEICSHILAVLDEVNFKGNIKASSFKNLIQARRNVCLRLVRPGNRVLNEIRFSINESQEHMEKKYRICEELKIKGKHFVCEAIFEDGSGRADILVLDDFKVIEIVHTETDESIEQKRKAYPEGIKLEVVKC